MKLVLVLVLISTLVGIAVAQSLPPDVLPSHPAASSVLEVIRLGIMGVFADGTFRGDRLVSRYELAASMNKLYQIRWPVPAAVTTPSQMCVGKTPPAGYAGFTCIAYGYINPGIHSGTTYWHICWRGFPSGTELVLCEALVK